MLSFRNFVEMVVYHGSKTPIEAWDHTKHISGYYPGFYTTSDIGMTTKFGKIIHKFTIDPEKYYNIRNPEDAIELKQNAAKAGFRVNQGSGFPEVQYLKQLGYHGIKRGIEYIVFEPQKVLFISNPL